MSTVQLKLYIFLMISQLSRSMHCGGSVKHPPRSSWSYKTKYRGTKNFTVVVFVRQVRRMWWVYVVVCGGQLLNVPCAGMRRIHFGALGGVFFWTQKFVWSMRPFHLNVFYVFIRHIHTPALSLSRRVWYDSYFSHSCVSSLVNTAIIYFCCMITNLRCNCIIKKMSKQMY